MAKDVRQIKIESILGGHAPTTHFAGPDQFRSSLGIDPSQPIDDQDTAYSTVASGLLRPVPSEKFSGTTIAAAPLWIVPNPKDASVYVYDARGSAYTINASVSSVTALSDGGNLSNALGNGMDYYDNYIYFARNTTIARYGPLNGAATFTGDYWVTGISQTALVHTTYPSTFKNSISLPNHVLHRHSDGRLYIADVVDNKGTLHYVSTSKTTEEGDTNNSSTYSAVNFGYGLWPTDIESYGTDIAVALYEGNASGLRQRNAKLGFWDTTSTAFNKITWVEFPDQIITALKNVNGTLFTVSGNFNAQGFRVCKFVGGYTFQEVFYSETGEPCLPGAIDGALNRLLYGSHTTVPESDGCVYATGLAKTALSQGTFNIMRSTGGTSSTSVTAIALADNVEFGFYVPIIGWTQAGDGSTGASHGLDKQGATYSNAPPVWWSATSRIGTPFKITKIRFPLAQSVTTNMTVTPTVYLDNGERGVELAPIDTTNFNGKRVAVYRPQGLQGESECFIQLRWTGSALCTVGLPITVEYEEIEN